MVFLVLIGLGKIMDENVTLILSQLDVGQILDALYQRLKTWRYTENFIMTGCADERYWPEECSCPAEARRIAQHYEEVIEIIEQQAYDRSID